MKAAQFKAIRTKLRLSQKEFGRLLGYVIPDRGASCVSRFENAKRPIPPAIARLAFMISTYGIPSKGATK
jgi:transcriptional regulator with XRE-family HTH domain